MCICFIAEKLRRESESQTSASESEDNKTGMLSPIGKPEIGQ